MSGTPLSRIFKKTIFPCEAIFLAIFLFGCSATRIPVPNTWTTGMSRVACDSLASTLITEMSTREKINQMTGDGNLVGGYLKMGGNYLFVKGYFPFWAGANKRLGVATLTFSDGPRGVSVYAKRDKIHRPTCFPVPMARGASFDPELEYRIGRVLGNVCINLLRHPGWGRAQETYGEDPHHLGKMGVALTLGTQDEDVIACAKHYALNNLENNRFFVDAQVSERTLREVYLPHFKACVDAGVGSIMSAYNKVNGHYCGENKHLLTDILKKDWGFEGFVVSDWVYGVRDGLKGANAGLDLEMPLKQRFSVLKRSLKKGEITEKQLNEAVFRLLRTRIWFMTREKWQTREKENPLGCAAHREIARETAEKSFVLLKNQGNLLPLSKENPQTIALIGRFATESNTGDRGSSRVWPSEVVTPYQGIVNYLKKNSHKHNQQLLLYEGDDPQEAAKIAAKADIVILFTGYDHLDEGENLTNLKAKETGDHKKTGGDRSSLTLTANDEAMIHAVAKANPNTLVAILSGSAVIIESWKNEVPGILLLFYPGMEGGNALARILFGDVSPSGKLPFVMASDPAQLPPFDIRAKEHPMGDFHGYTLLDKNGQKPAFPFGFGLGYSTFELALQHAPYRIRATDSMQVTVILRNTEKRTAATVVQVYAGRAELVQPGPPDKTNAEQTPSLETAPSGFSLKKLAGFQRIELKAGEERRLHIPFSADVLKWYDEALPGWRLDPGTYRLLVGFSSDEADCKGASFEIVP